MELPINPKTADEVENFLEDDSMLEIANIFYPKKKLLKKNNKELEYIFELDNGKQFKLDLKGYSPYPFLELNKKNELVVRKNTNTILIYEDCNLDKRREIKINDKIVQFFTLSNGNYLISSLDRQEKHYIYLVMPNGEIIKKQEVGNISWHSPYAIDESNGIIMFAEYQNFSKEVGLPKKVSVFRSKDMGVSWQEVFSQPHPDGIRHWHTLQVDKYNKNYWIVTSGDTPTQSRWFLSKNNGDSWEEITDKNYFNESYPNRSLSAHRTTIFYSDKEYYYWGTDDLMGNPQKYFEVFKGERTSSAKFYRTKKSEPIKIEKLTNLGIHARSMVDVGEGFLFFTEAKYVSYNSQIFYVDKSNLNRAYLLLDILGSRRHSGTSAMNSNVNKYNKFYIRYTRKEFLDSNYQTLEIEWEKTDSNEPIEYRLEEFITLEEHLWFLSETDKDIILDLHFAKNLFEIKLDTLKAKKAVYLESGSRGYNKLPKNWKLYDVSNISDIEISLEIDNKQSKVSCFVIEFTNNDILKKSYKLIKGFNTFYHKLADNAKAIKILFRFEGKDTIILKNLKLIPFYPNMNFTNDKKKIIDFILHQPDIDIKFYNLHINGKDSFNFKPRNDVENFKISLPMDWDIEPFKNDRNWKFHFHALRMIDTDLYKYYNNKKEISLLENSIKIFLDWKRDIIDNKKLLSFQFDHKSYAWYDMSTGLRAIKLALIFKELIKSKNNRLILKYFDKLLELINIHIKALHTQPLSMNNHGIFQVHGMMMLLNSFPESYSNILEIKKQTQEKMKILFYTQFFEEGIHKENSDKYHYFVLKHFNNLLDDTIYPNMEKEIYILNLAEKNCAYMHFPNMESLMIGDSDYKIEKRMYNEQIKKGITFFKESGYTYIYDFDKKYPSMLFFQTAFLNSVHRHADNFNILLYEKNMNILVDSGKYSYDNDRYREYCKSTRAHNVVLIDDTNYIIDGKYHYQSKLLRKDKINNYYILQTKHNNKQFNIKHIRTIIYRPKEIFILIDILYSKKMHRYSQLLHFHQDLNIIRENNLIFEKNKYFNLNSFSFNLDSGSKEKNIKIYRGERKPKLQGWRALKHKEIVENSCLENTIESKNVMLISYIDFKKKDGFNIDIKLIGSEINIKINEEIFNIELNYEKTT